MSPRRSASSRLDRRARWAALLLLGLQACGPPSTRPVPQDAEWAQAWWLPRHEQKLEEVRAAGGRVDVVLVGDSLMQRWESDLGRATFERYYGERRVLNLGFDGDKTEHVLWRLEHGALDGVEARLAIVMVGTNNIRKPEDRAEDAAAGVLAIVDALVERLPEADILLLPIFPRGAAPRNPMRIQSDTANALIEREVDHPRVHWLDMGDRFLAPGRRLPKEVMPDGIHPSARGYRIWAEAIEPTVRRLLGEGAPPPSAPEV